MGYSFRLAARVIFYASCHRQDTTYHGLCYASRGALAGTRNSSMGPCMSKWCPSPGQRLLGNVLQLERCQNVSNGSPLIVNTVERFVNHSVQVADIPFVAFIGWGARCSFVVRAFAHGTMGRRIDPSWGGPIELFLVPASVPRLV